VCDASGRLRAPGAPGRLKGASPPSTPAEPVEQIVTDSAGTAGSPHPEAMVYGLADEVIGGPAGAPESGSPA
jgi:hypothetical protein